MNDIKQAKSGAKITGAILAICLAIVLAVGISSFSLLILWVFAPLIIVSFVLFFIFIYRVYMPKK